MVERDIMKILLHMPHTSLRLPKIFYKGLLISKEELRYFNLKMTDLYVDYLFKDLKYKKIKAKYSRLFCDVEKFKDDNIEFMSKYGQGVIYTHTYNGVKFHIHNDKYKKKVYKYYDNYHKRLDKISKRLLKRDNELLIIDIHSFSDEQARNHHDGPFPDICIGVEEDFYDKGILDNIIYEIKEKGLTYKINYPYSGSLVPNHIYINKDLYKDKVVSIMLEINKSVYL